MTDNHSNAALILLATCLVLAYLLPYHMYPFLAFYNEWLALFGIVLVTAFLANENSISIRFPWIILIPLGLIFLVCVHMAMGRLRFNWDAVWPVAYLMGAAFALLFGATLGAQAGGAKRLCFTLASVHVIAGLISCLIATLQIAGKEGLILPFALPMPHKGVIRPYANLGQSNQLALLFCLAIASVWFLYQTGKLRTTGAVASILMLSWGLALTQSRIGWLIIPMMLLFTGQWRNCTALKLVSWRLTVTLTLSYGVFVLILPEIDFGVVSESRAGSPEERVGSIAERWVLIRQAWQISLTYPWLGAGWYEFGPQQIEIGAHFPPAMYSRHAHNMVLNFAAEMGWPATILIFTALAYWFYQSCLSPMLKRTLSPEIGFAILFLCAVFIHSLLEYPLWYAYVLIPTTVLMGAVHHAQLGSRDMVLPRFALLFAFMIAGAGLLTVASDYQRLVNGFLAHGWEKFGLKADEGSTEKPEWTLFPHFYDYFRLTKITAKENMSLEDIAFVERTAKRFGYPWVMMRMSIIYALNGRNEDAVRTIKTLKSLHPGRYREAYGTWKAMAEYEPKKYAEIFARIPSPEKQQVDY